MLNSRRSVLLASIAACIVAWTSAPGSALAQHSHEHASGTAASDKLKLDAGRKWPTDAALRSGMAEIRRAFEADHRAIHEGRETDSQYEVLATRIESQVNSIVAHCKLPAEADENLHYVIADLAQGVNLMRGKDSEHTRHDGAALVHGALLAYGAHFDDPGWSAEPADKH